MTTPRSASSSTTNNARRHQYGHACDWFALGCLLFELLLGAPPRRGVPTVSRRERDKLGDEYADVVDWLRRGDPARRGCADKGVVELRDASPSFHLAVLAAADLAKTATADAAKASAPSSSPRRTEKSPPPPAKPAPAPAPEPAEEESPVDVDQPPPQSQILSPRKNYFSPPLKLSTPPGSPANTPLPDRPSKPPPSSLGAAETLGRIADVPEDAPATEAPPDAFGDYLSRNLDLLFERSTAERDEAPKTTRRSESLLFEPTAGAINAFHRADSDTPLTGPLRALEQASPKAAAAAIARVAASGDDADAAAAAAGPRLPSFGDDGAEERPGRIDVDSPDLAAVSRLVRGRALTLQASEETHRALSSRRKASAFAIQNLWARRKPQLQKRRSATKIQAWWKRASPTPTRKRRRTPSPPPKAPEATTGAPEAPTADGSRVPRIVLFSVVLLLWCASLAFSRGPPPAVEAPAPELHHLGPPLLETAVPTAEPAADEATVALRGATDQQQSALRGVAAPASGDPPLRSAPTSEVAFAPPPPLVLGLRKLIADLLRPLRALGRVLRFRRRRRDDA